MSPGPLLLPDGLTSQPAALLQVVDTLPVVALAQLVPHQPPHHDLHPLLADDGILGLLQARRVVVVDAVECGGDLGLLGQEGLGLGSRPAQVVCWSAERRSWVQSSNGVALLRTRDASIASEPIGTGSCHPELPGFMPQAATTKQDQAKGGLVLSNPLEIHSPPWHFL